MTTHENDFLDNFKARKEKVIKFYEYYQRKLCESLIKHPVRHCLFHWSILFVLGLIVALGGYFDLGDISLNDFAVIEDVRVQDFFLEQQLVAFINRPPDPDFGFEPVVIEIPTRSQQILSGGGLFLYEADGEIFTPQNVFEMCELEKLYLRSSEYVNFCQTSLARGELTRCSASILSLSFVFYGNELNCEILDNATIQERLDLLLEQQKGFLFNDIENPTLVRSVAFVGGPLGEDSPPFREFELPSNSVNDAQATEGYIELAIEYVDVLFNFFGVENKFLGRGFGTPNFRTGAENSTLIIRTGSPLIENTELLEVLNTDQLLSAGSYLVVLIVVAIYIRSFVLAFVSMMGVLFSLVVALFLYALILQVDYFTPLNILVVFLVAGVGADNVLVLVDAWRQSELDVKDDIGLSFQPEEQITKETQERFLVNRLVYTMERSLMSVSNTSITTFMAFIATAISPIPAIAALGIFAALAILANWWFMFTLHPANLMWHYYLFVRSVPKDFDRKMAERRRSVVGKSFRSRTTSVFSNMLNFERGVHDAAIDSSSRVNAAMFVQEQARRASDAGDTRKFSEVDNFKDASGSVTPMDLIDLDKSFKSAKGKRKASAPSEMWASKRTGRTSVNKKVSSIPGDLVSIRGGALASMRAPGLQSIKHIYEKKAEKPKLRALDKLFEKHSYLVNKTPARYFLVIGMFTLIVIQYLNTVKLETPSALEANFGDDHMFGSFLQDFGLLFPDIDATNFVTVTIVVGVTDFDVSNIKKLTDDKSGGVHTFDPNFSIFSKVNQDFVNSLCGELPEFPCSLEGCLEDTLFRADPDQKVCTLEVFEERVKENTQFTNIVVGAEGGPPDEQTFIELVAAFAPDNRIGIIDGEIKFVRLSTKISLRRFQAIDIKEPVLDFVAQAGAKLSEDAPPEVSALSFGMEENLFLVNEISLVSGLFEGLFISLLASFFVLLIGTQSFIIAALAVISVGGVAVSVLGTIELQGGELGTAEAIAGVFVIGLSVDYIVHLGHMFKHSVKFIEGEQNPKFGSRKVLDRIMSEDKMMVFRRKDKVDFTLRKMGPTVLAGAITTLCAAIFLSLCTFAFFQKMSNMLLLTVVYALMASFFFFIPALSIFGPGK